MPRNLANEFENVIKVNFKGADKGKIRKFADVLAEGLKESPEEIKNKFIQAAPTLFQIGLSEQDLKSTIRFVNNIYKDDRFAQLVGDVNVEILGKMIKSTDEIFMSNFLKAALLLEDKAPLAFTMYFSDDVVEQIIKNRFSSAGLYKWIDTLLDLTNDGKAVDLLIDYLSFDEELYEKANINLSQFAMRSNAVFYEDIAGELESLIRLHYNKVLRTRKSIEGGAHTVEGDEVNIFLPYYVDVMNTIEGNKLIYCILADHEGGHINYGSFRALLPAFIDYLKNELGKEIVVKKLNFADQTGMKLKSITYEYEGKTYFANSLLAFVSLFGEEYAPIVKDLWNCIEDGKIDAWWLDEEAYGIKDEYLEAAYTHANENGNPRLDYSITGMRNQILLFVRGYAGATHRDKFIKAVFNDEKEGLTDEEKKIIALIRNSDQRSLAFLEKYSSELVDTITKRVYHTTPTIFLTYKIVNEWKELVEKGKIEKPEGKEGDGRIGGTGVVELDPDNISFEIGDESSPIPLDDLPDDLKEEFMKKSKEFMNGLDNESRKQLEKRMKQGKEEKAEKDKKVNFDRDFFVVDYDPDRGRVNPDLEIPIHIRKAVDCESKADPEVVSQLAIIFRKLAQPIVQIKYTEDGIEIDMDRRYEWLLDMIGGIKREPDYFIHRTRTEMRDVVVEIVVDASGSTSDVINGKRVIDYLVEATHATVEALSKIQKIKLGYSFYQSNGPGKGPDEGTTIYIGKDVDEKEVRFRKVEPNKANRDGAARRAAIKRLLQRKEPVKILIFICDSLPADENYESGVDDVRDARMYGEKKGIFQMTITTPVNQSHFSSVPHCKTMEEYFEYMYGKNWYVIESQKDLIDAYKKFFTSIIKELKTTKAVI